ncbi:MULTISPECIES: hypothetical protein [unclassified Rhodococcus (in: high G+C Gram-positive bacteria)]|uniref:hypothetical protein n=1 Tax=unclassified Rhodococcus (in: high G+C Gram-positive bacteria) TaxID=192944 RepID=UPI000B9C4D77|nr:MULTISPECIES: hypothetical protein [unclassified Rhodococcus (in: high G+C Gram-positive bacteria)]OZE35606.1 hypothetical protein CH259_16385 [Rhodococcus sp. 05-2254-4]OZE48035.1 hypothetical protein CH261_08980 [Rhodococcus sp. 05-2254-3]OZE49246.1 hypothetical protein CH283_16765 [Rhodococcus sp. 05-2254-2]
MKTIRWSLHRDDSKIDKTEDFEDEHAAARYVDTGMATYVDDPKPVAEPDAPSTDSTDADLPDAKADVKAADTDASAPVPDGPNSLSKPGQGADTKPAAGAKPKLSGS